MWRPVVLTPAVLAVVRKAKADPKPYLLACAFIANTASFVLPISDPANLVVFSCDRRMPPLALWLRIFVLPSVASILDTFLCLRWLSRKQLREEMCGEAERALLTTEGKLAVAAVALISYLAKPKYSAEGRKGRALVRPAIDGGLFVTVEALQNAGLQGLRRRLAG
jgi:Na+/H+ antiporter NhaD/arsenite permease-like protein